uniref:MPN domain-containing protein n=1 Tax=Romanomermis culicivorax TaxID=13658 RepID=A0A915K1M0_ROMCU
SVIQGKLRTVVHCSLHYCPPHVYTSSNTTLTRQNGQIMEQLLQKLLASRRASAADGLDLQIPDSGEQVYISSLALLKMLKHARAGVPMEVMGLMLGSFVDLYTVIVVDVFAMPQSGTGVSVEAVDPAYQAKMLEMLKLVGRQETVVGWYHSHPGFGCWFSSTDQATQKSFEQLNKRVVGVVVDPIQSVKGKVVIDAFRCYDEMALTVQAEGRETTSNIGHLHKSSVVALVHGLNKSYYSLAINYRSNELEQKMLLSVHAKSWHESLSLSTFAKCCANNEQDIRALCTAAKSYANVRDLIFSTCVYSLFLFKIIKEESTLKLEELKIKNIGKLDPKRQTEDKAKEMLQRAILHSLGTTINISTSGQSSVYS